MLLEVRSQFFRGPLGFFREVLLEFPSEVPLLFICSLKLFREFFQHSTEISQGMHLAISPQNILKVSPRIRLKISPWNSFKDLLECF